MSITTQLPDSYSPSVLDAIYGAWTLITLELVLRGAAKKKKSYGNATRPVLKSFERLLTPSGRLQGRNPSLTTE